MFFFSSRRRHTRCALVNWSSDVCSSDLLSSEARQRFSREAELLAQLEHPGIARVYAAGLIETDTGPLPSLAMQYVPGIELLEYARTHGLAIDAKLDLVAALCRSVPDSHSSGIVPRDLTPATHLVDKNGQPHHPTLR